MSKENKKLRRKARYEKNLKKDITHKKEAWENGKLIEPNHNNGPYPEEYCIELGKRLVNIINQYRTQAQDSNEDQASYFIQRFRLYRVKFRDFILHYNPDLEKTPEYEFIKRALELYWDEPENLYMKLW